MTSHFGRFEQPLPLRVAQFESLDQFRSMRVEVADIGAAIGPEFYNGDVGQSGFIYDGWAWIEKHPDGKFSTLFDTNVGFSSSDLAEVEERLYSWIRETHG